MRGSRQLRPVQGFAAGSARRRAARAVFATAPRARDKSLSAVHAVPSSVRRCAAQAIEEQVQVEYVSAANDELANPEVMNKA